jgi:hypothetical protein
VKLRIASVILLGATGSALFGLTQGCGTDESGSHGGIIGDAGTGGSANTDAGGSGGSHVTLSGPIGKACKKDTDCVAGLTCMLPSSSALLGQGPAGGVCTLDCSSGDSTTCTAIDPNSYCVSFDKAGTVAYCLEGCVEGTPAPGVTKCHNRKDMGCETNGNAALCVPVCRGDFDCAPRKCDLSTGMCSDPANLPKGTLPIGAKCDPNVTPDPCAGFCFPLTKDTAFCSSPCTYGQAGCGFDPTSTAVQQTECVWLYSTQDTGDVAFCGQLCDCDDDCTDPDLICAPVSAQTGLPRAGICNPKIDASTNAPNQNIPCAGGSHRDGGTSDAGSGGGSGGAKGSGGASGHDAGRDAH